MDINDLITLILKVFISALGTVGIIEFLKNFIKTNKTWVYSVIMPFLAFACFFLCEKCNLTLIGSILTVGAVQLNYQILVQGFKKVINGTINKVSGGDTNASSDKNENSKTESATGNTTDFSEQ